MIVENFKKFLADLKKKDSPESTDFTDATTPEFNLEEEEEKEEKTSEQEPPFRLGGYPLYDDEDY